MDEKDVAQYLKDVSDEVGRIRMKTDKSSKYLKGLEDGISCASTAVTSGFSDGVSADKTATAIVAASILARSVFGAISNLLEDEAGSDD